MRGLKRVVRPGWRWMALFAVLVVLPAIALTLLSIRAFQGEASRAAFQRRERQQQVLRLLENDLRTWVLSLRRAKVAPGDLPAFEVRDGRVFFPRLNVSLSPDYARASGDTARQPRSGSVATGAGTGGFRHHIAGIRGGVPAPAGPRPSPRAPRETGSPPAIAATRELHGGIEYGWQPLGGGPRCNHGVRHPHLGGELPPDQRRGRGLPVSGGHNDERGDGRGASARPMAADGGAVGLLRPGAPSGCQERAPPQPRG